MIMLIDILLVEIYLPPRDIHFNDLVYHPCINPLQGSTPLRGDFFGWCNGKGKNSPGCLQREHKMQNSERLENLPIKASFGRSLKVETREVVIE